MRGRNCRGARHERKFMCDSEFRLLSAVQDARLAELGAILDAMIDDVAEELGEDLDWPKEE